MCTSFQGGKHVCQIDGAIRERVRRACLVAAAILIAGLCCQHAWTKTLPVAELPQEPQTTPQQTAQTSPPPKTDLTQLSIENVMDIEVTSSSKKEQKLSQVAAAIFVIAQEDIRNSGASNIPD